MKRAKIQTYMDGYVSVMEDKPSRNSFGAKINEGNLVTVIGSCPFAELSQRSTDVEFAEMNGFSLSRKIKIQYCPLLVKTKRYKCIIDDSIYDVKFIDPTHDATYLYLEYVREAET